MARNLDGTKVAIILTNGVEQAELIDPRKALDNAGAKTDTVSPANSEIQAMKHHDKAERLKVDVQLSSANPDSYDALVIPAGLANPDELRTNPDAVKFARSFFDSDKPVAAICHGPWMLVEANVVRGPHADFLAVVTTRYS